MVFAPSAARTSCGFVRSTSDLSESPIFVFSAIPIETSDCARKMVDAPLMARKVQLEPGFSLPHWMKFSKDADLSGGVGKADPEDEGSWKVWPIAEIRKHDGPEDFWTVIRGKVYNLTPYMKYHPGGIGILMKTAGNDGTVLFDK